MDDIDIKLKELDKYIKDNKYDYDALYQRAELKDSLGYFKEARDDYRLALIERGLNYSTFYPFDNALKKFSESSSKIKELYIKAEELMSAKQYSEAINFYEQIISYDKLQTSAYSSLAKGYLLLEKPEKTIECCDTLINLGVFNIDIYLAYMRRAEAHESLEYYAESINDYKTLYSICPIILDTYIKKITAIPEYKAELLLELMSAIEAQDKSTGTLFSSTPIHSSRILKENLLFIDPNNIKNLFELGEIYEKLSLYQNAIETYTRIINIDNIDGAFLCKAYFSRGYVAEILEDYTSALNDYYKIIDLDILEPFYHYCMYYNFYDKPAETFVYARIAAVKEILNDKSANLEYYNIIAVYNKEIEEQPNEYSYFNRGNLYNYSLNEYDEAIQDYSYAIRLIKENKDSNLDILDIYKCRAEAYIANKQYYLAIEDCYIAQEIAGKHTAKKFYKISAEAKEKLKDFASAYKDYNLAINLLIKQEGQEYEELFLKITELESKVGDLSKINLESVDEDTYKKMINEKKELYSKIKYEENIVQDLEIKLAKIDKRGIIWLIVFLIGGLSFYNSFFVFLLGLSIGFMVKCNSEYNQCSSEYGDAIQSLSYKKERYEKLLNTLNQQFFL